MIKTSAQRERTHVLIIGVPRSGTSLLSSLLGAHPEIGLVCEDFGRSWLDIIGKRVVGNKLCVPRQIDLHKKNNVIMKLFRRFGLLSLWPKSMYSIDDYLELPNLKIIAIKRDDQSVTSSINKRGGISYQFLFFKLKKSNIKMREIDFTLNYGNQIIDKLVNEHSAKLINFTDLVNKTDDVLKELFQFVGVNAHPDLDIVRIGTKWNWMYEESKKGIDQNKK